MMQSKRRFVSQTQYRLADSDNQDAPAAVRMRVALLTLL